VTHTQKKGQWGRKSLAGACMFDRSSIKCYSFREERMSSQS